MNEFDKSLHRNMMDAVASDKYIVAWVDPTGKIHYRINNVKVSDVLYFQKCLEIESTKVIINDLNRT